MALSLAGRMVGEKAEQPAAGSVESMVASKAHWQERSMAAHLDPLKE